MFLSIRGNVIYLSLGSSHVGATLPTRPLRCKMQCGLLYTGAMQVIKSKHRVVSNIRVSPSSADIII